MTVLEYNKTKRLVTELIKRFDGLTEVGRHYATHLTSEILKYQGQVKEFETNHSKKDGRTYESSNGEKGCDECCNGDRCDDPTHYYRQNCPYCLGTGKNLSC